MIPPSGKQNVKTSVTVLREQLNFENELDKIPRILILPIMSVLARHLRTVMIYFQCAFFVTVRRRIPITDGIFHSGPN